MQSEIESETKTKKGKRKMQTYEKRYIFLNFWFQKIFEISRIIIDWLIDFNGTSTCLGLF